MVKVDENSTDGSYKNFGFLDGHTGIQDDYEYDVNGNMVKDRNKEIDVISYNHLNLPVEIDFETAPQKITYIYDATGIKLSKSVIDEGTVTTEYAGSFIYSNEGSGTMDLQFFSHPEGYVIPTLDTSGGFGGSVTYNDFDYVFQYRTER